MIRSLFHLRGLNFEDAHIYYYLFLFTQRSFAISKSRDLLKVSKWYPYFKTPFTEIFAEYL